MRNENASDFITVISLHSLRLVTEQTSYKSCPPHGFPRSDKLCLFSSSPGKVEVLVNVLYIISDNCAKEHYK